MEADIAASFVQISSAANLNENLKIFIHKYAAIQYTSHITSAVYKRSQSRDSSFIKVQFAGGEEENGTHAGVVQYYARAKLPGKSVVRIDLCKFYELLPQIGDPTSGLVLHAKVYKGENAKKTWTADSRDTP